MNNLTQLVGQSAGVLLSALLLNGCQPAPDATPADTRTVAGHYVVVYKTDPLASEASPGASTPGASTPGARVINTYQHRTAFVARYTEQMLSRLRINPEGVDQVYSTAIRGFAAYLTRQEVAQLQQDSRIAYVEPDRYVTPEPGDYVLEAETDPRARTGSRQEVPWGIRYVGGSIDYAGSNVAWIIDTGIDLDHKDLTVDASRGMNFVKTGSGSRNLDDSHGHGSHMAGIISARNNTFGVVGIAAGATTIPVKVGWRFQDITTSTLMAGIDYVAANAQPGDVVNISAGVEGSDALDASLLALVNRGDVFVAASAGNHFNGNTDANKISPARVNATNFYTVSGVDSKGIFLANSCSGNPPIDAAAPGLQIKSTTCNGGYATFQRGTSMSTAHVSGILLANGGVLHTKGHVTNDQDSTPDPIASRVP